MASNLPNISSQLQETFSDIHICYHKALSYIKSLCEVDLKRKCLIVFSEDTPHKNSSTPRKVFDTNNGSKSGSDLDLTGSPLIDDRSIHDIINSTVADKYFLSKPWHESEESFGPVDINFGRKVLMDVINQRRETNENDWIFILTDNPGKDREIILSTHPSNDHHVRGIGKYHGLVKHNEKSADDLTKRHSFMIKNQKIDVKMMSSFEINENITLRFVNQSSNLSINHVDTFSEARLFQNIRIGKFHENCQTFWSQIKLLNLIKNEIVNCRNRSIDGTLGVEPMYNLGLSDMSFEELQKKANKILTDISSVLEADQETRIQASIEEVAKNAKNRYTSDITHQLYDLLKFSGSYSDLKRIFTYIFQTSSRSGVVNVPTSNNRLGELIRDLSFQRLAVPHLVGTEPLELLFEIGVEKLMEDFNYILSHSQIGKLSDLEISEGKQTIGAASNPLTIRKTLMNASIKMDKKSIRKTFLKNTGTSEDSNNEDDEFRNSRFNEGKAEQSLAFAAKVYLIIEHLISIQNHIPLKHDYLTLAKMMMESSLIQFDELKEMKYDSFEFVISNKEVVGLVEGLTPNSQKFVLLSENNFIKVESHFLYNIEQIVPFLENENDSKPEERKNDSFHFYSYAKLSTRLK